MDIPEKITKKVIKRDGTVSFFDQNKIVDAIFAAAKAVGGHDYRLAKGLASKVTRFLYENYTGARIHIEEIQDTVEKVLIEEGHARTAKEYIIYRKKRAELRKGILVRKGGNTSHEGIVVDMRSSEKMMPWDKSRISSALVRELDLPIEFASEIAGNVENKIFSSGISSISTSLIRELVDNELFEMGMAGILKDSAMISFPTFNIEQYLKSGVPGADETPSGFNQTISRDVLRQYSLQNIFSPEISESHRKSEIHIHYLGDINRMVKKRHCGPVLSASPECALADLAFKLAELQAFFIFYPQIDYFNILFAPLYSELGEEKLRRCLRDFLVLLKQMAVVSHARGTIEIDIYGYIPSRISNLGINDMFTPLMRTKQRKTYKEFYREIHSFAHLLIDEVTHLEGMKERVKFNVHSTEFFKEDESERQLLETCYRYADSGGRMEFYFGEKNGTVDNRLEFLSGGDVEFHRVSVNIARLFFEIPAQGSEAVIEKFKTIFSLAFTSGIEKLDFVSSLMRKPGQILWKLGKRSREEPAFDILNSFITIGFTGMNEALMFGKRAGIEAGDILEELFTIAWDISDSKGDEHPFSVRILPGEMDSASFRFAETDMEEYPEKLTLFQINRDGRLFYEGVPEFYGDDPVPISRAVMDKNEVFSYFEGGERMAIIKGSQLDSFRKFESLITEILDRTPVSSVVFENK